MPPSVNHSYFTARNGQRILTKKAKEWIYKVQAIAKDEVKKQNWSLKERQKIITEIWTYWPDNRCRDTHNGAKLTFDSLEEIVYDNDRWVLPRYMDFEVDKENARVELKIYLKEDVE